MNKINLFSKINDLKMGDPYLYDMFIPIIDDQFILIDSGEEGNRYNHWQKVLLLLASSLGGKVKIYQTGGINDPPLLGVTRLNESTSVNQLSFLIKKSKCVITTNPLVSEITQRTNVPCIFIANEKYKKEYSKPNFNKKNFTVVDNDNDLKPENIAKDILKRFGIEFSFPYETVYCGTKYTDGIEFIDFVPNQLIPISNSHFQAVIRMDLCFNEENLINQLRQTKGVVVTNKEINLNILQALKNQITELIYVIEQGDNSNFCSIAKRIGIPISLFTRLNEEESVAKRLQYMEIGVINSHRKENIKNIEQIKNQNLEKLSFLSNRFVLSSGKIYPSEFHFNQNIPTESKTKLLKTINNAKFWEELKTLWLFREKE